MAHLEIRAVDDRIPGAAPVSEHSVFQSVVEARLIPASEIVVTERPEAIPVGGGSEQHVFLGGEWRRRAFPDDPDPVPVGRVVDDYEWDRVFLPDNYGLEPALSYQHGPVYYRKRVSPVGAEPHQLIFPTVDYLADVWIDGEHLGRHEGYFAPFAFDVGDLLEAGSVLTVRVQDPFEELDPSLKFFSHKKSVIKGTLKYHDSRPGGLPGTYGWTPALGQSMTTGGITDVPLLRTHGDVRLEAIFVTPVDHETGKVHVAIVVSNFSKDEIKAEFLVDLLALFVPTAEEEEVYPASAAVTATISPGASRLDFVMRVPLRRLWWPVLSTHGDPDKPAGDPESTERAMYHFFVTVLVDGVASSSTGKRFGIRTARIVDTARADGRGTTKRLEVNGEPVFVQAANYIPLEHFSRGSYEFYERDMAIANQMHLNSLGVHGHLQPDQCYVAADDAGILIFQDFPLQWHYDSGSKSNPGFIEKACRQIAEMAYTYWNHPSIVYWACHNEPMALFFPGQKADPERDRDNQVLDAALEERLRKVDPVRHVHKASGIGDDLHMYDGSLSGGSVYGVRDRESWFVSEYGFWAAGPGAILWNDAGWPPDDEQMKDWFSRLSFMPSTMGFAGHPRRYGSLTAWQRATDLYAGFLAKYQTEWMRIKRGDPFNGIRWHFFADWWGWAGGGLVDLDRDAKAAGFALSSAARPLLVATSTEKTVYAPGSSLDFPIYVINELAEAVPVSVSWLWVASERSVVIGADPDAAVEYGPWPTPQADSMIALPAAFPWRDPFYSGVTPEGDLIEEGSIDAVVGSKSSAEIGTVSLSSPDREFAAATLFLVWESPEGTESNWYHVLSAPDGWFPGPGAFVVTPDGAERLADEHWQDEWTGMGGLDEWSRIGEDDEFFGPEDDEWE